MISGYRETTLSAWPESPYYGTHDLQHILDKLYSLLPVHEGASGADAPPLGCPSHLLSHILHLSAKGYILPHVDNVEASAGTIAGISLGVERELVLRRNNENTTARPRQEIRLRLPPGSAYVQRCVKEPCLSTDVDWKPCRGLVRYGWAHSIPALQAAPTDGSCQRISVMIRVCSEPHMCQLPLLSSREHRTALRPAEIVSGTTNGTGVRSGCEVAFPHHCRNVLDARHPSHR